MEQGERESDSEGESRPDRLTSSSFLVEAVTKLFEFTEETDLYRYLCIQVHHLVPDAVVAVVSFDELTRHTTVQAVCGLGQEGQTLVQKVGHQLSGWYLEYLPRVRTRLISGKLHSFEEPLSKLSEGAISEEVSDFLEQKLGFALRYAVGLSKGEVLFGGIYLFTKRKLTPPSKKKIESLAALVSIVLQRIHTEQTVRFSSEARLGINTRRLAALSRMGQIVTSSLELTEVLRRVTIETQALLGVDAVSILLRRENELEFVAVSGESADTLRGLRIPIEVGAVGKAVLNSKPIMINREEEQEQIFRLVDRVTGYHTRSLLAVPLILNNTAIGAVEAVSRKLGVFSQEDMHTLESVANWAAIAIANAEQYATIQKRLRESEALSDIAQSLLGTLELEQVLQGIVDAARRLIPSVDRAVIHLLGQEEGDSVLQIAAATGLEMLDGPFFSIRPGEGIAGKVLTEGKTINVEDTRTSADYLPLGSKNELRSLMVAAIRGSAGMLGTISVRSMEAHAFSVDDERLLTLLGLQAALAINNARLFEAEQKSRQLAESLLQQEKATRAQMVQSEKLAALGRIVASVAHEINNPLQAIQNAIYLVQFDEGISSQSREDLQVALNETNRMAGLVARLRETYRPALSEELQAESLNNLVREVERLLSTHMRHQNIEFTFHEDEDLPYMVMYRDQIRQVILNISLNAIEAMTNGGSLMIETAHRPKENEAMITFRDTGPGIPADILPYIFDPFFTSKEGGTGLGLAITYDIVQRHQGRIEVESQVNRGTTFHVHLPYHKQAL